MTLNLPIMSLTTSFTTILQRSKPFSTAILLVTLKIILAQMTDGFILINCFASCIYLTSPYMSKGRSLFSSFAFLVSSAASF